MGRKKKNKNHNNKDYYNEEFFFKKTLGKKETPQTFTVERELTDELYEKPSISQRNPTTTSISTMSSYLNQKDDLKSKDSPKYEEERHSEFQSTAIQQDKSNDDQDKQDSKELEDSSRIKVENLGNRNSNKTYQYDTNPFETRPSAPEEDKPKQQCKTEQNYEEDNYEQKLPEAEREPAPQSQCPPKEGIQIERQTSNNEVDFNMPVTDEEVDNATIDHPKDEPEMEYNRPFLQEVQVKDDPKPITLPMKNDLAAHEEIVKKPIVMKPISQENIISTENTTSNVILTERATEDDMHIYSKPIAVKSGRMHQNQNQRIITETEEAPRYSHAITYTENVQGIAKMNKIEDLDEEYHTEEPLYRKTEVKKSSMGILSTPRGMDRISVPVIRPPNYREEACCVIF